MTLGLTIESLIGVLLAAAVIFYYRRLSEQAFKKFFSLTLIVAALIYVVFAIYGALIGVAGVNWFLVELGGVLIYSVFSYLGVRTNPMFLAIGWATHVVWDVALHLGNKADFVPHFYPGLCIGFDLAFAAFIVYKFFIAVKE